MNGSYSYQEAFLGFGRSKIKTSPHVKRVVLTETFLEMTHMRFEQAWSELMSDSCFSEELNGI